MKIIRIEPIINAGEFSRSSDWVRIRSEIFQAIKSIEWPHDSGSFILHDESGKKRGQGSGVKPIKDACMLKLQEFGWQKETPVDVATVKKPGRMDATCRVGDKLFCMEWETGNVSSSHRALDIEEGVLAVIAIEHDGVSKNVPRIPKGTDGRALL